MLFTLPPLITAGGTTTETELISVQNPYEQQAVVSATFNLLILLIFLVGGTRFELVTPAV